MSDFPKCCTFVHPLHGRLNHSRLFDHRPWATSMDDLIIVHLWTTYLDDHIILQGTVINNLLIQITFLNLLRWFLMKSTLLNMDGPYGRIRDGTNFSPSYQLPLRSKGRPGHWCNLKLICMGLRELCVAKPLVDLLSSVRLPRKHHASLFEWCASFHWLLGRLRFLMVSPRVIRWMGGVTSLSPLLSPIYSAFPSIPFTSSLYSFSTISTNSSV